LQTGNSTDVLIAAIERIEVSFPPGGDIAASVRKPNTGVEARFSLEYVIAACLLRGELRLEDFSSAPVATDIAALAES
ncbi:MmgE/PrpD family protein, partial [Klebsiella pneumoniae]|nr:MmgE/PrpD family protein [Klebsiella pneumoniae]